MDNSVANWGHGHATPGSTDLLDAVTNLGEPMVVAALAAVLGARRDREDEEPVGGAVPPGGRRRERDPHHDDQEPRRSRAAGARIRSPRRSGPRSPSGHSSWSAAFFAAAALLLGRGRGRGARAAIAGVAAGLALTVAGSRVLLGVHWLSDVIAGLALGSAWFAICAVAFGGRLLRFGAAASEASRVAEGRGVGAARSPAGTRA